MSKRIYRALLVLAALALFVVPMAAIAAGGFTDVDDTNVFKADIDWLAATGVTKGCNPPANDKFCPQNNVTREQMAAFMRRLAEAKVVKADTAVSAETAAQAANATAAGDSDKLDGKDSTAFMEYGTITTTVGGAAWMPHVANPTTVTRYITGIEVSGDGAMVLAIEAPESFNGVGYGLESIEVCIETDGVGFLTQILGYRSDSAIVSTQIMGDATDRTASGCYVYPVGKALNNGAGIYLSFDGGGFVRINGTTLTWSRAAFLQSAPIDPGTGGEDG